MGRVNIFLKVLIVLFYFPVSLSADDTLSIKLVKLTFDESSIATTGKVSSLHRIVLDNALKVYNGPEEMRKLKKLQEELPDGVFIDPKYLNDKPFDKTLLKLLNKKLLEFNIPTVQLVSEDLSITPVFRNGALSSKQIGLEIRDGKHRYCLPCSTGHNSYISGVFTFEKSKRNKNAKYYPALKCIETIQEGNLAYLNGYLNIDNWPQKRFLPSVIDQNIFEGVLIVTDEAIAFYEYLFPDSIYEYQQFKLPSGKIVELRWNSNLYSDVKEPSVRENSNFIPRKKLKLKFWQKDPWVSPLDTVNLESLELMLVSTLQRQMSTLLAPDPYGREFKELSQQCKALKSCSKKIEPLKMFSELSSRKKAQTLISEWSEIADELGCI